MFAKRLVFSVTAALLFVAPCAQAQGASSATTEFPSDEAVRQLLTDRIDVQHRSVGIVVGLISPRGRRVIGYGRLREGVTSTPDGETVFEIGSVTKVFTGLLFTNMILAHEVALEDPVQKYFPSEVPAPEHNGHPISLLDLATHTSGLPFWPTDMPAGGTLEAAKYTVDQLQRFVSHYPLPHDPGAEWAYSNIDYALLGQALAHRAGMSYERLLTLRILTPLGMRSTSLPIPTQERQRLAAGHDIALHPAPEWDVPALAPAGSLHSTANDLLRFLSPVLGLSKSPLQSSMRAMLETHRPATPIGADQTLGWWIFPNEFGPVTLMVGGTAGFASTVVWDGTRHMGVVVLSNSIDGVQDLALHLLRPALPLTQPAGVQPHTEIALDPALLDRYVGSYQPAAGPAFVVSRAPSGLMIQFPGAPPLRLRPESEQNFFLAEINVQISFELAGADQATALIVHSPGTPDARAARSPEAPK